MLDPRWWMVSVPSLITNDFVMTSLLLLKIIVLVNSPWFYCRHLFLTLFRFMATLRGILILPLNSAIWRQNDVKLRYCVNQVNYLCLDDGNDECIILCNFVGRDWSVPSEAPHVGRWKQKKPGWIGLSHRVQDKIDRRKAATISLVNSRSTSFGHAKREFPAPFFCLFFFFSHNL